MGCVVSYSISTSNHNLRSSSCTNSQLYLIPFLHQTTTLISECWKFGELYLIPFLHQTTTGISSVFACAGLYLIPFLHQTTTTLNFITMLSRCILFHFYIKPQPRSAEKPRFFVVSYSISTSNHNCPLQMFLLS